MKIGIISNSDLFIPLAYALAQQTVQVHIFYSLSADLFANQKAEGFSAQFRLPFSKEKNKDDLYNWLNEGRFDACFVIGYPGLIKLNRINVPLDIFNIHFGSLPAFKGPSPVFWQLKKGVKKLGMAIHRLTMKLDDGPVVWIKEIDNLPYYNFQLVHTIFSELIIQGVFYILNQLSNKVTLTTINNASVAAYYKRPTLEDVTINWKEMTAEEICHLVQACNPWNKGASTTYNNAELKIVDALAVEMNSSENHSLAEPGTIIDDRDTIFIACVKKQVIKVSMFYFQGSFIPSYYMGCWSIKKGALLLS